MKNMCWKRWNNTTV